MFINDLSISLMVIAGLRFIGFLIFLNLFLQQRHRKYLVLSLGWLIYMLGPIPNIINPEPAGNILHPLFGYSASVGTLFLLISVYLYFREINNILLNVVLIVPAAAIGLLIGFFNPVAGLIATVSQGIFLLVVLYLVIRHGTQFRGEKSGMSFFWLCSTLTFGLIHAFGFTLFFPGLPLSVRFVATFLINISLLEYFIYMDWEQSVKKLRESDERYRFIFNTAPVALIEEDTGRMCRMISTLKSRGIENAESYFLENREELAKLRAELKILEANNRALMLFGAETRAQLENGLDKIFVGDLSFPFVKSLDEGVSSPNRYSTHETVIRTLDDQRRDVIVSCYFPGDNNLNKKSIVSMVDITEKNEIRREIEKSLREKELLLQEVHHRVNNNLAIISSILGLQSRNVEDEKTRDLIQSMENRISTMALVHEQLYRSSDVKNINIASYLRELTEGLQVNLFNVGHSVNIMLDIEPVRCGIDGLIPLGLLVNEIVINAFRHAFRNTNSPCIFINMHRDSENYYLLSIRDNGKGIDRNEFEKLTDSTGFTIIDALVHQLGAEMSIETDGGTDFRIILPAERIGTGQDDEEVYRMKA